MNKIIFLSFGSQKFYNSLKRIKEEAESFYIFDHILIYNEYDLMKFDNFSFKHKDFVFNNNRGYGYWIWKSFLVKQVMKGMNENDILVYADSGCTLNKKGVKRLFEYFNIVNNSQFGILSFQLESHLVEKKYTKMDVFYNLNCLEDKYLNSIQLMATSFILRKCSHTEYLISEWYNNCCIYKYIDDTESILNNDTNFVEHRHDQSIFSLIRKKFGTEIIDDETWFGNLDWNINIVKNYPILAKRII